MLNFILNLESLLKTWPENTKYNLIQVSELTGEKVPHAVDYVSQILPKAADIHEPLTFNEVNKVYNLLREKKRSELNARFVVENQKKDRALKAFEAMMAKIKVMDSQKQWRQAYKTLSYFYGSQKQLLTSDVVVAICDEALRIGIKEKINLQELSLWLKVGVQTLLVKSDLNAIEDALDFLDAYGDYFLENKKNNGEKLISEIFLLLKPSAMEFELTQKFNEVARELRFDSVMDVISDY